VWKVVTRRIKMSCKLEKQQNNIQHQVKQILPYDTLKIAKTMLAAYMGTVDQHEETIDEAVLEVEKILNNGYGPYIAEASFFIEKENEACAVICINLWENKPLITEIFVGKNYVKQGMASTLIKTSMNELFLMGHEEIVLYVTLENVNAVKLYEKLGFVTVS
jgi:GNAT superfamily N-acetyltransferase